MDLKLSNKINTLVIHVMQNQTEDLFFLLLLLVFFGNDLVSAIILLLPLKEFSCSCVHVSCLFSHVFLTAQEKGVETQENEHVKNVKWTGKSKEVFERRQRQSRSYCRNRNVAASHRLATELKQERVDWSYLCSVYVIGTLSLFWLFTD